MLLWLRRAYADARRDPGPASVAGALGVLAGILVGATLLNGPADATKSTAYSADEVVPGAKDSGAHRTPRPTSDTSARRGASTPGPGAALERAVAKGASTGERRDGVTAMSVAVGTDPPTAAGPAQRPLQMWSVSKAVTAVALYRATRPPAAVAEAMARAIRTSENCPQRAAVLALRQATGGAGKAADAFDEVLRQAGARAFVPRAGVPLEPDMRALCVSAISRAGMSPDVAAPQLGTATWTVDAGARFAQALARKTYGTAGDQARQIMAAPKRQPAEGSAQNFTADPAWGAGRVLQRFGPAYKSGWGGSKQSPARYVISQVISLRIRNTPVGISVAYWPKTNPPSDDPGKNEGPAAIADALEAIVPVLDRMARS